MQDIRKRAIRIEADSFREKCNTSRYGIINLFQECRRYGYKLLRYPLGQDGPLGFVQKKDLDTIIFTNSSSRLSREIFTLAHEIGHVLLHMNSTTRFVDNDITISGKSTDYKEQEANYFAACLLMPEGEVDRFLASEISACNKLDLTALDIARIMSEFDVSFDMVLNRLESLGKINTNEKIKLDNQKNINRVGNLLKSVGGNSRLNESTEEIDLPYEYLSYVIYNYNHKAIPLETLEKALACYNLTVEDVADRLALHEQEDKDIDDLIGGLPD